MQQKVAEYIANLLMAGVGREKVAEMGYHYALSLQSDELPTDSKMWQCCQAKFMLKASEVIRDAMPKADKIHHERCMIKPIAPVRINIDPEVARRAFRKDKED